MDLLKKVFPLSFNVGDVVSFVVHLVLYVLLGFLGGLALSIVGTLLGWIPVLGWLLGIVLGIAGAAIELYSVGGIVLAILVFVKVLK